MLSFPSAHPAPYKSGKIELKEQVGALRRLPHSGDVKRGTWNALVEDQRRRRLSAPIPENS